MARLWLISAHLFLAFTLPSMAEAQAGLQLAAPGESPRIEGLGRDLHSPVSGIMGMGETSESNDAWPSLMPEGWNLDVSALTSVPLSVGLDVQVQSPVGVFANLSVGHTPSAYLDMVAGLLRDNGVFGNDVQPLISETTRSGAWNFRLGVGVNLIEGLELSVGYTLLTASSSLSASAIEAATGQSVHRRGMTEVPVSIEMHALHGRVAYRFLIEDRIVIRAAIGWTHAVAASVHVDVPDEVRERPDNPATEIEQAVAEGFDTYGFTPELQLSAGYRF